MTPECPEALPISHFRVSVLGEFSLEQDGFPVDTTRWQRRVATLFRLLATAPGRRRSRDQIIDILWPDASADTGGGNLRLLVHRLRLALGVDPSPVLTEGGWIVLNPAYDWEVDLERFETLAQAADIAALEEAASLYRGEPLPEDRYEDWAGPVREHATRAWRDLSLRLAALYRTQGELDEAMARLEGLVEIDPLDEEAVRALLLVLSESGRRAEALRRYSRFEVQLRQELDVSPSRETEALVDQIKSQLGRTPAASSVPAVEGFSAGRYPLGSFPGALPAQPPMGGEEEVQRLGNATPPRTAASPGMGSALPAFPAPRGRTVLSGGRSLRRPLLAGAVAVLALASGLLLTHRGSPGHPAHPTAPFAFTVNAAGGSGPGQFHGPTGMAVDAEGRAYVADYGNNRVQVFAPDGSALAQFGTEGSGPGQLKNPTDVAIGPAGAIFVDDYGNNRIQKVLPDGTVLDTIVHWSKSAGGPSRPDTYTSVAVDRHGHVYATDLYNNRVVEFLGDPDDTILHRWGGLGSGPGQFRTPTGIAVDGSGNVYVVDTYNNRIQKFTADGRFLAAWGSFGAGRGHFHTPEGVTVGRQGNIYVADTRNHRIVKLSPRGAVLATWGTLGRGAGQFNQPSGVAVDRSGDIYVTDFYNNRVEKLSPTGKPLWETHGPQAQQY